VRNAAGHSVRGALSAIVRTYHRRFTYWQLKHPPAATGHVGGTLISWGDVAEILVWVASRPPHVNIDELIVKCTDQAAIHKVHRRK
jgi:NADP-dependent 3-hydroxy acid dehydrogenase YdfG